MQETIEEFVARIGEINLYLSFLKKFEDGIIKNFFKKEEMNNILKSNCFLMLYNLIESTFINGIDILYNILKTNNHKYQDISDKLKDIWFNYSFKKSFDPNSHFNTYKTKAYKVIDSILKKETIKMDRKAIGLDGNLDCENIMNTCNSHGIGLNVSNKKEGGAILHIIKLKRNDLAHGAISFSECGKDFSYQDLKKYKNEIMIFLYGYIKSLKEYIDKEEYLI